VAGQDPFKPKDDGKIKLPKIDSGMNKLPSGDLLNQDGKGQKPKRKKTTKKAVRPAGAPPAYSESNEPEDDTPPTDKEKVEKPAEDEDDDAKLLARIRKRFERCMQVEMENRRDALDDLKFKGGEQWPAAVAAQRNLDRRPMLTINKLPTFIRQVTNDQRQNRPTINVRPVGDKGDPEAAKMYRGMIRAIERQCSADIAYDTAFENAVSNGFGYFRILTEYVDPMSREQTIIIKRVRNPFTVYLDPDAQEPDAADAKYGFVTEMQPRDEFESEYPGAQLIPFTMAGVGDSYKEWANKDAMRKVEYFEIETKKKRLVELENGWLGFDDDLHEDVLEDLAKKRTSIVWERESEVPQIKWYKATALEILERGEWLGKWIPIVKVIGNELDIEGKVKLSGIVRDAKDPQRMVNYWSTMETELIALAPKAPYIVEEGQIEGYEQQWKNANVKSYPYLQYKGSSVGGKPAPPPQRQPPIQVPAGVVTAKQGASQDMMAVTGIRWDANMTENRVDESGKAVTEKRRSADLGSFHFVDNLARSLKHCGTILIDLIPKIYDTRQVITILREDDSEEQIQIDPNAAKPYEEKQQPNGKKLKIFNPKTGKYGVTVTIGPSFATRRVEASQSMMEFAKAMPNVASLVADLIAKYQDWEGSEEMAARLAKAVPPQLLAPDKKDIPPQLQAVMQHMDQQIKQLTQQLQQAMAALNDKGADRAVALKKIEMDFEAKLFSVVQRAESDFQKHIGSHVQNLADDVRKLHESVNKPNGKDGGQAE
jgi:Phage P22-like portal protein